MSRGKSRQSTLVGAGPRRWRRWMQVAKEYLLILRLIIYLWNNILSREDISYLTTFCTVSPVPHRFVLSSMSFFSIFLEGLLLGDYKTSISFFLWYCDSTLLTLIMIFAAYVLIFSFGNLWTRHQFTYNLANHVTFYIFGRKQATGSHSLLCEAIGDHLISDLCWLSSVESTALLYSQLVRYGSIPFCYHCSVPTTLCLYFRNDSTFVIRVAWGM